MSNCGDFGFKYCPAETCKVVDSKCVPKFNEEENLEQEKSHDDSHSEMIVEENLEQDVSKQKSIFDLQKLKQAYPSLDENIIKLVASVNIPLDQDFKIMYYLQLTEKEKRQQFLEEQYRLFIAFKSMFRNQLSRIFSRDVTSDIDRLIENDILHTETFILANTTQQFQIISSFLKGHVYNLYTHYNEIPEHLLKNICNLCGAQLISRYGMTDNNQQGYIVSADNNQHLFHFSCLSNWTRDLSHCNVCNKSIEKDIFSGMTQTEKQMATNGSNFLDGYLGGKRSKKKNNRRRYKSRK
jgi:hypothetical protein